MHLFGSAEYFGAKIKILILLVENNFFYDFIFYKSEIRTSLLEVGIVLGLLKKVTDIFSHVSY